MKFFVLIPLYLLNLLVFSSFDLRKLFRILHFWKFFGNICSDFCKIVIPKYYPHWDESFWKFPFWTLLQNGHQQQFGNLSVQTLIIYRSWVKVEF